MKTGVNLEGKVSKAAYYETEENFLTACLVYEKQGSLGKVYERSGRILTPPVRTLNQATHTLVSLYNGKRHVYAHPRVCQTKYPK